jgi:hypothetical protein
MSCQGCGRPMDSQDSGGSHGSGRGMVYQLACADGPQEASG